MRTNRYAFELASAGGGLACLSLACVSLTCLTACSGAGAHAAPPPGAAGSTCGSTRTGANVPVVVKVVRVSRGSVDCATVMSVESGYAKLIESGKVPGNGGGAPVRVGGWTCQGYATPRVLRTGNTSECHTATAEVVAVLKLPSSHG